MNRPIRTGATLSALLVLGACASPGDYPSLARREAERISASAEPVATEPATPAPMAPPDAALSDRLAHLVAQAESAHRRFLGQRGQTEALIGAAGGAAVASESWSVATVALAGLEAVRSETMIALAELDEMHAAERVANYNQESGDGQAIAASRAQVIALVDEEDRILSVLRGQLRD